MMRGECPRENVDCPLYYEGCFTDVHHLYFPRRSYKSRVEKDFRNLPDNKEVLCRDEHNERHATELPPLKPTREEMLGAIAISSVPS